MNFVSLQFLVLFGIVLVLIAILRSNAQKKILLLAASAVFYAAWDWRFLVLLAFVICVDYFVAKKIAASESPRQRRALLILSLAISIGIWVLFKYFNFFLGGLTVLLSSFQLKLGALKVALPLGLSFYILSAISYIVDVYREGETADSLLDYALFLGFFPRLAAGPIMRAHEFLPQLKRDIRLTWPNFLSGAQMFGQGLLKKLVVADRLAFGVQAVFATPSVYSPASVWVAVLSYSVQIYFDFSGYSDMAIGLSRILGFELPQNFNLPYTAQSFSEFWQRWHISLSVWLRDYIFFPLRRAALGSKNRLPAWLIIVAPPLVTMLVSGFWHGVGWTFVVWGAVHGIYLVAERLVYGARPVTPSAGIVGWLRTGATYLFIVLALVIFRSPSLSVSWSIYQKLFFFSNKGVHWYYTPGVLFTLIVILGGMIMRIRNFNVSTLKYSTPFAYAILAMMYVWAYIFAAANVNPFVYFQF